MSLNSNLTILRRYALKKDPSSLPKSVLHSYDNKHLIIFDVYPKALFHFLILPRPVPPVTDFHLTDLKSLLAWDKGKAKQCLTDLDTAARNLCGEVELEMQSKYGFTWPIWVGFHAVPSMCHVHLHVISSDLHSPFLKTKKHYNSFHPKLGFFLHLKDVFEWFEATDSYWTSTSRLPKSNYEPLLKEGLLCWSCGVSLKNIPTLKDHLKGHFDDACSTARTKNDRRQVLKRVRDEEAPEEGEHHVHKLPRV